MPIPGNLMTTAMAVMPHVDIDRAIEVALSVDIPYWPQLPLLNYYEDMYVQASEHFPGILLDLDARTIRFSMDKFAVELEEALANFENPEYFDVGPQYSAVYPRFLELDLADRPAIRGQLEGPISFGLNINDENDRPILFDDTVRPFLLDFMSRRINVQLGRLKKKNPNAFMFIDEPGLQFIFSALSGYNNQVAFSDMEQFYAMVDRPRGVHLCGNPDWDFLLNLDLDILSMDIYTNRDVFVNYAPAIKRFLDRGGVLAWGIAPTNFEPFEAENLRSLEAIMEEAWSAIASKGIDRERLLAQSLLSPATCCLVNADREKTVEKSFKLISDLSEILREKYF